MSLSKKQQKEISKNGTKLKFEKREYIFLDQELIENKNIQDDFPCNITNQYTLEHIADGDFELIEEPTIDIDSIEELDEEIAYTNIDYVTNWNNSEKIIVEQQNNILRAVKHLNKEIQSIKEK